MIKPVWRVVKQTDFKMPQKMQLNNNLIVDFDLDMSMISLRRGSQNIGYEILSKEKDFIKGIDIKIENPAEKRKGFGSLLRALSVMLLKENNAKYIKINSLPQALKFHYVNGFRTASGNSDNAIAYLRSVINSKTPFENLKKSADDLLQRLYQNDKNAIKDSDQLYDKFLKSVFKNEISLEDAAIPSTVNMKLTLTDVMKNNSGYNNILKKFGIDYTI